MLNRKGALFLGSNRKFSRVIMSCHGGTASVFKKKKFSIKIKNSLKKGLKIIKKILFEQVAYPDMI